MLAFTHPGKIGDLLYCLPVIKQVCEQTGKQADFWTSSYCYPIVKRLLERQSYIRDVVLSHKHVITGMDMGVRPWLVPVDGEYERVYHLGFQEIPRGALPKFIANSIGQIWNGKIHYEYDDLPTLEEPYIVLAPRGETSFKEVFLDFIEKNPIKTVIIGGDGDYIGNGINKCGLDLLETLPWIAKSKGFIGLMSSQLVLANGFDIPKISPHDGRSWDMGHVIYSDSNFYPVNPTAEEMIKILKV